MSDSVGSEITKRSEGDEAPVEEEDVSLLLQPKPKWSFFKWLKQRPTWMSMAMFFMLICGGLLTSGMGPAMPIIEDQCHINTTESSYIFTGRYVGYLAGSLFGGPLYDIISREGIIFGTIVIIGGAMFIPFPFFKNVWVLTALSGIQGMYFGASDAGNSVSFLRLHGSKANPWLQAMHFTYAIGTTIGPFIEGALIHLTSESYTAAFELFAGLSIISGIILCFMPPFDVRKWTKKDEKKPDTDETHLIEKERPDNDAVDSSRQRLLAEQTKLLGPVRYWLLISTATLYLMLYVTLEATFGSYISLYTYKKGMANIEQSSYVASVFWGGFCLGRGLSVITSTRLSPRMMCFFGVISATLVMTVFVIFMDSTWAMWIAVGGFGLYIAPLWASLWAYMGEYVEMSGKAGTAITIGSGIGSIIVPTVVGQMMDSFGPEVLLYQQLICCVGLLIMLIGIIFMTRYAMGYVSKKRIECAVARDCGSSQSVEDYIINDVTSSQTRSEP